MKTLTAGIILACVTSSAIACAPAPSCYITESKEYLTSMCRGDARRGYVPDYPDSDGVPEYIKACKKLGFNLKVSNVKASQDLAGSSEKGSDLYNYVCTSNGRSLPLQVDASKNTLVWNGDTYTIKETPDCAKFGWRAAKSGSAFNFCTATQGSAYIEQSGADIQCTQKGR